MPALRPWRVWLLVGLLVGLSACGPALAAPPIRICANQALGEPGDSNSAYRLVRMALAQLPQLSAEFILLPWQRCLSEAAAGRFDAVLSASHTAERAQGLLYPYDAKGQPDAALRMFHVGYVLLRRRDSPVSWDGERFQGSSARTGEAIGAERGYSIVQFARERGATVEDRYPQFGSLADSLKLRRIAAMLVNQESAAQLLADPAWSQGYEISGPTLQQRAYFLPFSRAFADAHPQTVAQVWQALARARQSAEFQLHFSLAMSAGQRRDLRP